MKYPDGQEVQLGDRVELGKNEAGVVVCSIDTNEFNEICTQKDWGYLKKGVIVRFPSYGLIHYEEPEPEPDLRLIARGKLD
ncbi:MAG: hypothetical protein PHW76_02725 [Alphaproteobacteria bacterium]|nr:hypothetical protein [Alphaproteobacteria bacterium]